MPRLSRIRIALGATLIAVAFAAQSSDAGDSRGPAPPPGTNALDPVALAGRLASAVRFRTVSHAGAVDLPESEFAGLRDFLELSYPAVHAELERRLVSGHALLYVWPGRDPSLGPIVLMGHQDVVPAENLEQWTHPPFDGAVQDGHVFGRGAYDSKLHVIGILEAVETLLREGFVPAQTVYLAFGHDEEVDGTHGAGAIAKLLRERGVRPALVLDEGGAGVLRGAFSMLPDRALALVAVAEKGAANVTLVARYDGPAHSSVPPPHTPLGRLARAISRLEETQRPECITPATGLMLDALAPALSLPSRLALAGRPLTSPLVARVLLGAPLTAALVRTTTAPTMIHASEKENVLAREARAVVNFRIIPGETVEDVLRHVRETIDDPTIEVGHYGSRDPSPLSDVEGPGFALLARTIAEQFPEAILTPWLATGGTDARYFRALTPSVYRFTPARVTLEDLSGAHGVNERVSIENLVGAVRFYRRLLENATLREAGA
jgi:carboxypeptidase PM20D1